MTISAYSLPLERHNVSCDPSQNQTCVTIYVEGSPQHVDGIFVEAWKDEYIDYTNCSSGQNHFTDVFVHGMGTTGDGVGFYEINGCFNPLTPGSIKFSTETISTTTSSYTTWLNNLTQ